MELATKQMVLELMVGRRLVALAVGIIYPVILGIPD